MKRIIDILFGLTATIIGVKSMKRKVITIDEAICNGCGLCVKGCHEGALQLIDGKARIINEVFCDGLGACRT